VDVESDRSDSGLSELVHHARVVGPGPRPAIDGGNAASIDFDDVQFAAGRRPAQPPSKILEHPLETAPEACRSGQDAQGDRSRERPGAPMTQARLDDGHRLSPREDANTAIA